MNLAQIIISPVVTEKAVRASALGKYTFNIHQGASKVDVKRALNQLYGVEVAKVNILRALPKFRWGRRRRPMQKRAASRRAIVTLKPGQKLDLSKTAAPKKEKKEKAPATSTKKAA